MELEGLQEYFGLTQRSIYNDLRRFHVFAANRIKRIKSSTEPRSWRYIASEDNQTDHVSYGLTAEELVESNWFIGPSFLWQRELPKEEETKAKEINNENPELKRAQVLTIKVKEERSLSDRLERFSDWR